MINLTKVKSNSQFNTLILSAKRMIWYKLIGFNENYSWATYQLQNYEVRSFQFLTIWMRLEWTQSILSSVSSTPRKKTTWSVKFHDFQKHNITWDTIQWRCRKDDISRRTVWFARIRNLQKKKHTLYPWVWWSRSRDMWFGRYRWSWRLKIWSQIFADHCEYIIVREIDVKKYSETNFINIMRYYQCKIQYLPPTCQNVLPSNVVTSVSLTKSEGEFTQENDS